MAKVAERYLEVDPWSIIEKSFHPGQSRVSESVFSLGNEYMGVRGYFEEGFSGERLLGSYFNGFFEETPIPQSGSYKGLISKARFMVNTVDWLFTRVVLDGETLDLAKSNITDFTRVLDFRTGTLNREFIWHGPNGKCLKLAFSRFISMNDPHLGCQRITLTPLNFSGPVAVESGLDFAPLHEANAKNWWGCPQRHKDHQQGAILGKTLQLGHYLFSGYRLNIATAVTSRTIEGEKYIGETCTILLQEQTASCIEKLVTNYAQPSAAVPASEVWRRGVAYQAEHQALTYDLALSRHAAYWQTVWDNLDIEIAGDPEDQQGIRFCIFQLHQTIHGANPGLNIGAKGLTGEAYNGHTFWDTETYCLPFYLFNNPAAARNLLEFRYRTLPQALERAKELDCQGAFYPIATIDGSESCGLWQHASLQLQVGSAVAYGIRHYVQICQDFEFLYRQGIEMLIEISRCLASRGLWSPVTGEFGFYGVMGPDEFQLMVNNNCYLNYMGKKTFEYTLAALKELESTRPERFSELKAKTNLSGTEIANWREMAGKMRLPQNHETKVFEQHDGFFDLPHLAIDQIPVTDFPLYHNWSYDRIYRYDMIKQPDVLMFLFLFNQEFTEAVKRVNYDYYEPRCIHESSLSPSIHSILATELGYHNQAFDFFGFATRLDLDNYNRNTDQGLHITSLAAAWMNIVYGFGGMRTDQETLVLNPAIPQAWQSYRFRIVYRGATLSVAVTKQELELTTLGGPAVPIKVYGTDYQVDQSGIRLPIPERFRI